MRAYLALGSNLGDRLAHLQLAVDALAARRGGRRRGRVARLRDRAGRRTAAGRVSSTRSSRSTPSSNRSELLARVPAIEACTRRVNAVERWGPRTLDVDVLLVDDVQHRQRRPHDSASRACGSAASCSRRCVTLRPTSSTPTRRGRACARREYRCRSHPSRRRAGMERRQPSAGSAGERSRSSVPDARERRSRSRCSSSTGRSSRSRAARPMRRPPRRPPRASTPTRRSSPTRAAARRS